MDISVSDRAIQELAQLGVGGPQFLRIAVVPGGCAGMTYSAGIDSTLSDEDSVVFQHEEVRIVADEGSAMYLQGLEIDYSDDLVQSGFRFRNTMAAKSCGCGSSFGG